MNDTYEKDVTESLGNSRNLILLGVRADADIKHLKGKLNKMQGRINELESNVRGLEAELSGWADNDSLTPNP